MVTEAHSQHNRLGRLLLPSALSGFCSVSTPLVFVGTVVAITRVHLLTTQFGSLTSPQVASGLSRNYALFANWADQNPYARDLPLLVFWALTGLVVYVCLAQIIKVLSGAIELEHEMYYVHARRGRIIRDALLRLLVRIGAIIGLSLTIAYALHHVLPRCLAAATAVALHPTAADTAQLLLATALLMVGFLLQTILLRLLFLRLRVLG